MKIAGIIAEYNPFHNGHAHHIAQTRRQTRCDFVVVCMDGSYTQRGEAACMDKWTRARAALLCGADAVFELPALWAVRTADVFARGGAAVLGGVGCDVLSFGSECSDMGLLEKLAQLRTEEPEEISAAIRAGLDAGMSHARARGEAIAQYLDMDAQALNAPNLTLGVEYMRAIQELGLDMDVNIVKRIGGYHDGEIGAFSSASAIRAAVQRGENPAEAVPDDIRDFLPQIARMHAPDDMLMHALRNMSEAQIRSLPDVDEGLEKRLMKCAREASTREELLEMMKCKRYTHARLSRLCAHALLGLTRELAQKHPLPGYARLIGLRKDAKGLMAELKERSGLPIVSDAVQLSGDEVFQLECRATDVRALQCDGRDDRRFGQEFTKKFVVV